MKIEQAHIDQIRKQFEALQSKEDLLKILNDAKNMLYGEKCKPFQLKSLTYYANPVLCKKRYKTFTIKKKSGEDRTIQAPVKGLKSILRSLNFVLQCVYEPHQAATGFVLDKSIVDNAKKHVGHHYVLNMDLKDFFHTFDRNRVKMGFMFEPFNLNGDKEPLAFLLACLCTHPLEIDGEVKTVLPQGSPTSPTITNILCKKLDRRLTGLANRFGATYTRYADDITFSSPHNIYTNEEFNKELKRIIEEDQKLVINPKKTRLQKSGYRQEATGLIVNEKVNVRRRYVKQIRMWLYYWEKYGYEKAEKIFKRDYIADKGHVKKINARLVNVLDGKLEFLKMVKGVEDGTYNGLKERFDKLTNKPKNVTDKQIISINYNTNHTKEIISTNANHIPTSIEETYPKLHNPKQLVEILKYFNSNNSNLKYSTHSWEFGKYENFEVFHKQLRNEWKKISPILKSLNTRLHAKINSFLFNDKLGQKNEIGYFNAWGEKSLKFGWSSKEVKIFCETTNNNPLLCPIPNEIRELDKQWNLLIFKDYVDVFKNEIEFREDSGNLKKLFLTKRKEILSYDFKIDLQNLDGISFYTDVAYFSKVVEIIFHESFKPRPQYFNILVKAFSKGDCIMLSITQIGSVCQREVNESKIIKPTGFLNSICENMINLADFSICSVFNDQKCYRINYLVSQEGIPQVEKLMNDEYNGFTYEFKFYL